MNRESAIETVRKLLAFAASKTSEEAGTAGAKAQRLIARFNLDEVVLAQATNVPQDEPVLEETLHKFDGERVVTWPMNLCSALGRINGCKIWYRKGYSKEHPASLTGAGRKGDLDIISYLMSYFVREVENLSKRALADWKATGQSGGKTWTNSFKLGCVTEISDRLYKADRESQDEMKNPQAAYEKAAASSNAEKLLELDNAPKYELAVVNNALIYLAGRRDRANKWAEEKYGKFKRGVSRPSANNYSAYGQGRAAGRNVNIRPSKGLTG